MDNILQALLSWQMVLFGLGLVAITFVVRKFVEFFLEQEWVPTSKKSKFWTEVILPILPVVTGPIVGYLSTSYPYPEDLKVTSGRVFFGLVAGLLSGLFFRVIKGALTKDTPPALATVASTVATLPGADKVVAAVDPDSSAQKDINKEWIKDI